MRTLQAVAGKALTRGRGSSTACQALPALDRQECCKKNEGECVLRPSRREREDLTSRRREAAARLPGLPLRLPADRVLEGRRAIEQPA